MKVNTTAGGPPLQAATLGLTEKPASVQEQSPVQNGGVEGCGGVWRDVEGAEGCRGCGEYVREWVLCGGGCARCFHGSRILRNNKNQMVERGC